MIEARSKVPLSNLQETLDASAASTLKTLQKGLAQYITPSWFAQVMAEFLPGDNSVVFDPQCGERTLLDASSIYGALVVGVEIDTRRRQEFATPKFGGTHLHVTANCCDVWRLLDEFYPDLTFRAQVANPPFGLTWRVDDTKWDSTHFTWTQMLKRAGDFGCGYMIANRSTIEQLGLHTSKKAYLYQTFPVGIFDANVEIGVIHFSGAHTGGPSVRNHKTSSEASVRQTCKFVAYNPPAYTLGSSSADVQAAFTTIAEIIAEEKRKLPPFNIYLDERGRLRTHLSTRHKLANNLTKLDIDKLAKVNGSNPLTLTTERDTRLLMAELIENGVYTIQPEAAAAMKAALAEVATISCPIMPATDFELVAYADENEAVEAINDGMHGVPLTKGKRYPVVTSTYAFMQHYQRMRMHLAGNETYVERHDMQLSGQDRYIAINDDRGVQHRFLDRPDANKPTDHPDSHLWDLFAKPVVPTIADKYPGEVEKNRAVMEACEMLAGFTYYEGQRDFYARVAVRDYALVGAATGTGKTLGAITLIALKAPRRALIVAPQGTTRSAPKDEDAIDDLAASQWITELRKFAPGLQVFELFNEFDYERILDLNGGELPHGVYVSYYEAMFSNASRESYNADGAFGDTQIAALMDIPPPPNDGERHREWCDGIGDEHRGIRCIVTPCLATRIGHQFDFVALDEAHKAAHLSAHVTQMIVRMQPKYRYALTATPIPNLVTDIFPLMGWLCVPGWYRGEVCNAAWPFARKDAHRFGTTFLSSERDFTQEQLNKAADPMWRGKCESSSPIISSPARLLKLIKPTMAFISKEACNPAKPKVTLHDVRVQMGRQQAKLYGHYMNRANVEAKNPRLRAAKQIAILRDLCAAPAASDHNKVPALLVRSNFNPKAASILALIRDIITKGQQVVVVCSRLKQSAYLERKLIEAGVPVSRIDSSRTPDRHTGEANNFKAGVTAVMLMGIKCAQAHSFDRCPNLIVGSLEYSFGVFEQAAGRIDRVTSKLPMNIWCVLHKNSIEEIMFDIVATKGDAATICLRGQRVPRDFIPADLGEVLAKNFQQFSVTADQPDEGEVETQWPQLCAAIRVAISNHPCRYARKAA